ncbi:MAG: low-specificity L-threonine aldolase, partial [Rubrivivax sp.]|nr:low-specificity L-threonine aldolase [Rubrivivax sp.]
GVTVTPPQTNIVFAELAPGRAAGAVGRLAEAGLLCTGQGRLRFVTHLDVTADDIERAIAILHESL